jgi:hypothetical protein
MRSFELCDDWELEESIRGTRIAISSHRAARAYRQQQQDAGWARCFMCMWRVTRFQRKSKVWLSE